MYNELYKILNYNDKKDNNDKKLHKKVDDEQSKTSKPTSISSMGLSFTVYIAKQTNTD